MTFRKSILLLIGLSSIAALVACSSSSSSVTTQPITVTLSTTPAALYAKDTTSITATVANDTANGGVSWSCAPAGTCGTFSASSSASGAAVTYTAPATVPSSTVVITATSVTNTSISVSSAAITINPASGIEITLSKAAQWSLAAGATATIGATVANDSANAGVNWSCTPATTCGSFSPSQTASGATTTYTAPATAGTVVITATSVTDDAQLVSTTVSVVASGIVADGNYVFTLSGADEDDDFDDPFVAAGVIVVKGGAITGGEQDWGDYFTAVSDQINGAGSSISTTADGNLHIVLQTCNGSDCTLTDTTLGVNGVETLNAALVSPSRALITEFDAFASASGTLDLQTSTAAPSGGYAFFLTGQSGNYALEIGGVINVDGSGTISGTGSVFDANDSALGAVLYPNETLAASTVSGPDSNGRVLFTLNPTDSTDFPQIILAGYIVDATHIRLVEVLDTFDGFTAGTAFSQGTNTGTFSSTSVSGNSYVAGLAGYDDVDNFQLAGLFTTNADGTVGGTMNYNDLTGTVAQSPSSISGGTYTVDPTGRVTMAGITDGNVTYDLQFYLDGNGNAPAISMDYAYAVAGPGYQQTGGGSFTAASFSGTYVMNARGLEIPAGTFFYDQSEFDSVGPIQADGIGTFSGFVDLNWFNGSPYQGTPAFTVPTPDLTVSGAFTAAPSGIFTGTITGLDVTTSTNQDAFTYYVIDTTRVLSIETDPNQLTLDYFELQPPE
ncbi:MAG: hypothetical protein WCF68_20705 [Terriglobales bacterium]